MLAPSEFGQAVTRRYCEREDWVDAGFNPSPAKGRPRIGRRRRPSGEFRSTPPRRATARPRRKAGGYPVSIHAPAKGRHPLRQSVVGRLMFRSTPPRRGDPRSRRFSSARWSFDPRPREGATSRAEAAGASGSVSIHAPAKGRRAQPGQGGRPLQVSIHAPAKGRPPTRRFLFGMFWFRSTPPRRGDIGRQGFRGRSSVSIHAPAKGRPVVEVGLGSHRHVSIHAPAKGRPSTRPKAQEN